LRGYRLGLSLLLSLTLCLVVGCSRAPVSASAPPLEGALIWQDGQEAGELEGSSVEFEANGTVAGKANILSDGTFQVKTPLPEGQYRMRVVPASDRPKAVVLDARFQKFETSGLTVKKTSAPQYEKFRVIRR